MISFLDNELGNFAMQQAIRHYAPEADVSYRFFLRGAGSPFSGMFFEELNNRIKRLSNLKLIKDEAVYLASLKYFSPGYIDWLKSYRYNPAEIDFHQGGKGELVLEITGRWSRTVLWKTPVLALISEIYSQTSDAGKNSKKEEEAKYKNSVKQAERLAEGACHFVDFSTRCRRSSKMHEILIRAFVESAKKNDKVAEHFKGTNNLHFARQFDLQPFGVAAREWVMAYAGLGGIKWANHRACRNWIEFYKGKLDIAVANAYATEHFFREYDAEFSHLFSGLHLHGGDACAFADDAVKHYNSFNINPADKTIIFSSVPDIEAACKIEKHIDGQVKTRYGFGSFFADDANGSSPLDAVIKLTDINGRPVYQDT